MFSLMNSEVIFIGEPLLTANNSSRLRTILVLGYWVLGHIHRVRLRLKSGLFTNPADIWLQPKLGQILNFAGFAKTFIK